MPSLNILSRIRLFSGVTMVLLVLSLVANGYLGYRVYRFSQDPQKQAQEEMVEIVSRVSKLMVLPEGENPTIATVTDPTKLEGQAFFVNAQAGDKVLLYTNAKKAILYSPANDRIVEVAPINLGSGTSTTIPSDTATSPEDSDSSGDDAVINP